MGLDVSYKGEQIARLSATGTATLKLAGKTCEGDILLSYSAGGISGGGISGGGISGGGASGSAAGSDVVFYDSYDHSVVASYSAAEFARLSALPANPEHAGLIAQGWNWTLENAKAYAAKYGRLTVGQMFVTDDGKTRIHIHLEPDRTTPVLGLCVNGSVSVDWGDGSEADTLTGTSTTTMKWTSRHSYPGGGDYVISLAVNGSIAFSGSNAGSCLLCHATTSDKRNKSYENDIKAIEIGNGLAKIGTYSFQHCYSLTHVTIPNGVGGIDNYAFQNCYSLPGITIPNGAAKIGDYAFQKASGLSYISLPTGITAIGNNAFEVCHRLNAVSCPEGVKTIGSNAFHNCFDLTNAVIPDTVTKIGGYAFAACYSLRKAVIPDSVTTMESYAFSDCIGLTELTVPGSIVTMPIYAFNGCNRVISTEIMDGVSAIGNNAFSSCHNLEIVTVPASITSIGNNSFGSCQALAEFRILAQTPPTITTNTFNDTPDDLVIYVPKGTLEAYQAAANWTAHAAKMREMEE